ncbi:hypothetical protein D3C87_1490470 [compost metagenome]
MFRNFTIRMAIVVKHLHFQSGTVSLPIFGKLFFNIKDDPAIGLRGNFPVQFQMKIAVFFVCYQVAALAFIAPFRVKE